MVWIHCCYYWKLHKHCAEIETPLSLTFASIFFTHWVSLFSYSLSPSLTFYLPFHHLLSTPITPHLIYFRKPLLCLPPLPFTLFILLLPLAAAAGGGTTVRRATATGGTNIRRARGARRAKRPARISAQTKRTRRPWSSDHLVVFFPLSLSVILSPALFVQPRY